MSLRKTSFMHSQDIFLVLFNKTVRRHTIQYNPYLLSIVLAFLVTQLLEVFSPNLMVKVSTILLSASPMEKRKKKKLRDLEIETVKILVQVSFWRIESEAPENVDMYVSFVRIQRNIFANFVHSPEFSTLRRRISSYLWSRGLTRLPKSFP